MFFEGGGKSYDCRVLKRLIKDDVYLISYHKTILALVHLKNPLRSSIVVLTGKIPTLESY